MSELFFVIFKKYSLHSKYIDQINRNLEQQLNTRFFIKVKISPVTLSLSELGGREHGFLYLITHSPVNYPGIDVLTIINHGESLVSGLFTILDFHAFFKRVTGL